MVGLNMDGQAVVNEEIRRQIMDHMGKLEVAFRELDPEGKGELPSHAQRVIQ